MLAHDPARVVELLDADVVEVHRAVHRRTPVGLGDDQQAPLAGPLAHSGRELGEGTRLPAHRAQQAQPTAGLLHERQLVGVALLLHQLVLPIPEEGEVVGGQPVQEVDDLMDLRAGNPAWWQGHQLRSEPARCRHHARPVVHGATHIVQDPSEVLLNEGEGRRVGLPRHLEVHPGLKTPGLGSGGEQQLVVGAGPRGFGADQPALVIADDRNDGVHDDVDPDTEPVELSADRVHEERHVVGHDRDDRAPARPPIVVDRGIDGPDDRLLRIPIACDVDQVGDGADDRFRVAALDVGEVDVPVEQRREPLITCR